MERVKASPDTAAVPPQREGDLQAAETARSRYDIASNEGFVNVGRER
jgi:hypothetical protein